MIQIESIILYGRLKQVRRLDLRLGDVNIISGDSATGKSALIKITEYVLGGSRFEVYQGPLTKTVSWYALLLRVGDRKIFLARPNPDGGNVPGDMVLQLDVNEIPASKDDLVANSNASDVRERLATFTGITPNRHEPLPGQTRYPLEARLVHALIYCFQAQTEIAQPDRLFHKQADPELPQAIKDSLPYFLGAVGDGRLQKVVQLRQIRHSIRQLELQIAELNTANSRANLKAESLLDECKLVGIAIPESGGILDKLRLIAQSEHIAQEDSAEEADPTDDLRRQRLQAVEDLYDLREQLSEARAYQEARGGFAVEARQQLLRLSSVNLLPQEALDKCPVCLNPLSEDRTSANDINESFLLLESQLASASLTEPKLASYIAEKEAQIEERRIELERLETRIQLLIERNRELGQARSRALAKGRAVGRISVYLEAVEGVPLPSVTAQVSRLEDLQRQAKELSEELDDEQMAERLDSALAVVSAKISELANRINLEHAGLPIRLDIKRLNLVIDTADGSLPLSRVGSAENWVGGHLIASLALQHFFVTRTRPVPSFLFLDQPTQAYYPADSKRAFDEVVQDKDREAVEKLFRLMISVVDELAPNFQIIVTDHAFLDNGWFRAKVTDIWRDGEKLVPLEWIGD